MGTSSFIGPFGTSSGGGGGGSINSVSGTANQIDVTSGTDPIISLPAHIIQNSSQIIESNGDVVLRVDGTDALTAVGASGQIVAMVSVNAPIYALNNASEITADGATNAIVTNFGQDKGLRIEYGLDPVVQLQNLVGDDGAVIDVKSMQVLGTPGANFGPALPTSITVVGGIITAIS